MKRIITTLICLLAPFVFVAATATPAEALVGYRQIAYQNVGDFAQLKLFSNGSQYAAEMWHTNWMDHKLSYTDVWVCATNGGDVCTGPVVWESGGFFRFAGPVKTGGTCVHASGGIIMEVYNFKKFTTQINTCAH
jgi:hypothetical protein